MSTLLRLIKQDAFPFLNKVWQTKCSTIKVQLNILLKVTLLVEFKSSYSAE